MHRSDRKEEFPRVSCPPLSLGAMVLAIAIDYPYPVFHCRRSSPSDVKSCVQVIVMADVVGTRNPRSMV